MSTFVRRTGAGRTVPARAPATADGGGEVTATAAAAAAASPAAAHTATKGAAAAASAAPPRRQLPAFTPPPRGTRAGPAGHSVVSTGLRSLDALFGGGAPLGTLTLLLEDSFTTVAHDTLLRHFCAEGVACGHELLVATADSDTLDATLSSVPAEAEESAGREANAEGGGGRDSAAARGGRDTGGGAEGDGLKVAFQYRRYINKQSKLKQVAASREEAEAMRVARRGGVSSSGPGARRPGQTQPQRSHRFDLLAPLTRARLEQRLAETGGKLVGIAGDAAGLMTAAREPVAAGTVRRVVVRSLSDFVALRGGGRGGDGGIGAPDTDSTEGLHARTIELVGALRRLKAAVAPRCAPGSFTPTTGPTSVAIVSVAPALVPPDALSRMIALADGVVALDQVFQLYPTAAQQAQVHEGAKASCVLRVLRRPLTQTLEAHAPGTQHLLRIGRHRAVLEVVQQPPEEGTDRPTAQAQGRQRPAKDGTAW